jgi:hypothetical protein
MCITYIGASFNVLYTCKSGINYIKTLTVNKYFLNPSYRVNTFLYPHISSLELLDVFRLNLLLVSEIWFFRNGEYKDCCFLRCDPVWSSRLLLTFWRYLLGKKSEECYCWGLHRKFLDEYKFGSYRLKIWHIPYINRKSNMYMEFRSYENTSICSFKTFSFFSDSQTL